MPTEKEQELLDKRKGVSMSDYKSSFRVFSFVKPYRWSFYAGMFFLVLSTVTSLVFPYVTGKLVDTANNSMDVSISEDFDKFFTLENIDAIALMLLGILFLQSIFSYLRVISFANVSERAMADIRRAVYNKIITLAIPFFEERRVGELTSRITSDVTQLQDTLSLTLAEFLRQIATLIIGVSIIVVVSPKLTLMMLATFPLIVIVAIIFGRFIRKLSKQTQDALANANVIVEETFQAVDIVKAFTNELYESKRFGSAIDKTVNIALKAAKYRGAFITFVILGLFGGIVLVLWYGAHLVSEGTMSIGELMSFIIYTAFIGGAVAGMGDMYAKIQKTVGASERLLEILEEGSELEMEQPHIQETAKKLAGKIAFDNVSFAYPTRNDVTVLKHVDFNIPQGSKIALVGPSGAGKSTVIQLLLSFYKVEQGHVWVDDQDIDSYNLTTLRQNIGIVPQDVLLFGGTIKENISYGKPGASDAEIEDAARKANTWEFIQNFPDGLDTIVGERGVKLSGGQKQRVAIARAILKDPSILILDEATSSLDSESEVLVQEALNELMQNRTTIIIAHRLSTIRQVDNILVLNEGKIVESGNHDQLLLNKDGLYYSLLKLQFSNGHEELS